jgi:hypothetical protein
MLSAEIGASSVNSKNIYIRIYFFDNFSLLCLHTNTLAMESEKQVNHVCDEESPTDSSTPTAVQDEAKLPDMISGGYLKGETQSPVTASSTLEQWNEPRINMYRYLVTLYTFIIMGMNDAAYGVSSPAIIIRP